MGKLLLLGYFGAGNLGDDGFVVDFLKRWQAELRQHGQVCDVTVAGTLPPMSGFLEEAELSPLADAYVPRARALLLNPREYHALIAPGGSLLQNATSLRSLLFYLQVIHRFANAGVPVYMLGQGIGPLRGLIAKTFTPRALSLTRLLALRDSGSHDWCKDQLALTAHRELHYSADPLLAGRLSVVQSRNDNYGLLIPKSGNSEQVDMHQVQSLKQIASTINANGIACQTIALHGGQDAQLAQQINGENLHNVLDMSLRSEAHFSRLLGLIAGAQFVVSYRLHGLILAASYGVPGLGVAYDPKVSAFCREHGLPWCTPQDVLKGRALKLVEDLWQNRETLQRTLILRRESSLERLARAEKRFAQMLWGAR